MKYEVRFRYSHKNIFKCAFHRALLVQGGETALLLLDEGQAEKPAQVKDEKKDNQGGQGYQNQCFFVFHGDLAEINRNAAFCVNAGPARNRARHSSVATA